VIEWGHRQLAVVVSVLVFAVAGAAWWLRRAPSAVSRPPSPAPYWAVALLVVQVLLGAITVKLELPHWTVVLHLATAMLLFATLLLAALGWRMADGGWRTADRAARAALIIGFLTVLLGGMTAKMGAAGSCTGFPLCNGQIWPTGDGLQHLHWVHRLFAYALTLHVIGWAVRSARRKTDGGGWSVGPWVVLSLVSLQVVVAAGMVMGGLPPAMQALHVAVGTAVWGGLVIVNASRRDVERRRQGEA
jgi:heme a synthase